VPTWEKVQALLRSVTSIDAVQLRPSVPDSWWATWVMPSSVIVTVQRVRSPIHLITSPSISSRERWTLPRHHFDTIVVWL
jgi:hypothetical protein